jgi:hypothetical protein
VGGESRVGVGGENRVGVVVRKESEWVVKIE